ncbi:hypothetical protein QWI17_12295 [Gilvimarinus sp. SDUM040013]|uniref:Uncharacterized protein n=1 Tax=Gilvimarinus gilvus TaxID=3058038 RepID=A0ABU4RX72_9GAMM|nr:hypothetical protein [Gilvimarinus sp. SDUM040013]MDO3386618.1 hypothetical protein [Gilvimarinus sp. SDUM040013]MDX6849495.1 hypothetical protein [Gilvimarinus sp. SDUM040013]
MKLDDLKQTFREETQMIDTQLNFATLREETDKFERQAKRGWILEVMVAVAVIVFVIVGWASVDSPNPLFQLGMASMIASCVFVAGKIIVTKRQSAQVDDWTLANRITRQIEKLEQDARLLQSVASWYLTPLAIAVFLCSWGGFSQRTGQYTPDAGLLIYWAGAIILYLGVYALNVKRAKTKIRPMIDQLKQLKQSLNNPD